MTTGMPPAAGSAPKSTAKAVWSLVLGILGILCCQILAPIAWILGHQELQAIKAGVGAPSGHGLAMAGMVMGIIGTVLLGLSLVWLLFFGGLAILSGAMGT